MRSEGVLSYKTPEIELHLAPAAMFNSLKDATDARTPEPEFTPEFVEQAAALGLSPEDYRLVIHSAPGV